MGDHVRRTLRYSVEQGERVEGYLLLPKPLPTAENPLPLVLCPHPTHVLGKDVVVGNFPEAPPSEREAARRGQRMYGLELVRRGFVVFAPDRAAFGSRRVIENQTNGQRLMAAYREKFFGSRWPKWSLTAGKNVWDLQRALDFLLAYDFIDPARVGIIGHSLGGWDAMMLTSLDERVRVAVVNAGGGHEFLPELWTDAEARSRALEDRTAANLNLLRMTNIMFMGIAPRPVLYIHGANDGRGNPDVRRNYDLIADYYRQVAGNQRRNWRVPFSIYFHSNGHSFEADARALAYAWLEVQLGLRQVGGLIEEGESGETDSQMVLEVRKER